MERGVRKTPQALHLTFLFDNPLFFFSWLQENVESCLFLCYVKCLVTIIIATKDKENNDNNIIMNW